MRNLLLTALMANVAFAGCTDDGQGVPRDEETGDGQEGRTSQGSGADDADYERRLLFEAPVSVTVGQEQRFDVTVEDAMAKVSFRHVPEVASLRKDFRVELSGCGAWSQAGIGFAFGQGITEGDVCTDPAVGSHELVIASTDSHLDGTIELWGHTLRGNATA